MHNIKQSDIVRHKRRGTYGIVAAVDNYIIRVVWHLGDGMRTSYDHKATTKVVELVHKYSDYGRFYEAGRTGLAAYFGYKFDRNHNRSQALGAWLDSFASDKQRGLPMEDDEPCQCLTRETTVLRNVITSRTLQDMQDMIGPARAAMDFNVRATGRSSGIALTWLAACIEAPYIWHKATDHPVDGKKPTMYMNEELFRLAQRIISILEWKGWEYHKTDGIRFVPIVRETTKYEPTTIITSLR